MARILATPGSAIAIAWSLSNNYFPIDYHFLYLLLGIEQTLMLITTFWLSRKINVPKSEADKFGWDRLGSKELRSNISVDSSINSMSEENVQ
jgi:hypothetical protein